MIRNLSPILAAALLLSLAGCRAGERPVDDKANLLTETGILRSGIMAIGGEHTGWVLTRDRQDEIELDVSQVIDRARQLDGKRVRINALPAQKNYTERGPTPILRVIKINPLESKE